MHVEVDLEGEPARARPRGPAAFGGDTIPEEVIALATLAYQGIGRRFTRPVCSGG
jgi:hypothetical protein